MPTYTKTPPLVKTKSGVKIVKNIFDESTHQAIKLFVENNLKFFPAGFDDQEFNRTYYHNLPFFVALHQQLTDFASEKCGEKLKPSYVFLSNYFDGGKCPLHIDRPQCRYTIDYLIDQSSAEPWPIDISNPMADEDRAAYDENNVMGPKTDEDKQLVIDNEKWTRVLLEPNDAVIYSGTHSWHYRPTILSGSATLAFFHFVQEEFSESLN